MIQPPPEWPGADVDRIRQVQVLATTIPGAFVATALLDAAYDEVWAIAGDLAELPRLLPDVRSVQLHEADDRLELSARGPAGARARFDVVLQPGWCVLQSRFIVGAIAAEPEGARTRFAFLGGLRVPGAGMAGLLLRPAAAPYARSVLRRLRQRIAEQH